MDHDPDGGSVVDPLAIIEAILFVAEQPLTAGDLAEVLELPRDEVVQHVERMAADLADSGRGVVLREVAGGWRLYTHPDVRPYVERFATTEKATRLSAAALETLAVVAYKQPIARSQIGEIRGVDPERALRTLERRGLVTEVGRAAGPGQAVLYGTTDLFLEKLGLRHLGELPPLADHVPPAEIVDALEAPFRPEGSSSASTS